MSNEPSDFADDVVGNEVPSHILPGENEPEAKLNTEFRPWHRVRKQFIREQQWNQQIRKTVERYILRDLQKEPNEWGGDSEEPINLPDDARLERPLRCLVIPGDDLLDVRSLWSALRELRCFLRFIGFNETLSSPAKRERSILAESAVCSLDRVDKSSCVLGDPFQRIAQTGSQAFHIFRQNGPYHVVNLDLCDSIVPLEGDPTVQGYYSAMEQLMRYQLRWQTAPWLFFVTTQVEHSAVSQDGMSRLAGPLRENCDQHAEFATELAKLAPRSAFSNSEHKLNVSALDGDQLVKIFGVVFGKWLLTLLSSAQPQWNVRLLPSYRYVLKPDTGVEMLSLAFLLQPAHIPPVDKTGMSNLPPPVQPQIDELQSALKLISAAANVRDVNAVLNADPALFARMSEASADLLASAGYDRAAYIRWVENGEP